MKRRASIIFSIICGVVFVAAGAEWVHSYVRPPTRSDVTQSHWRVESWRGKVAFMHCSLQCPPASVVRLEMIDGPSMGIYVLGKVTVFTSQPMGRPRQPGYYGMVQRPYYLLGVTEGARLQNGFGFALSDQTAKLGAIPFVHLKVIATPCWFMMLLAGAATWWPWRRRRRRPAGHCTSCGYDLRATPERCPECGSAVESAM